VSSGCDLKTKMSFKKYPEIKRLGHEDNKDILTYGEDMLFIEEKVDGGNGSMCLDDKGIIHFGSRNRDLTIENDDKAFARQQIQIKEHIINLEKKGIKLNPDYYYYFEWMAPHTIKYISAPFIIGLDIRMKRSNRQEGFGLFLSREMRESEFNRLEIENVPLVWKGKVIDLKKMNIRELIPSSKYYDGGAEGIVIKNYSRKHPHENHQLYAKVVRDEFKEDNRAVFGGVKNKDSDTNKIVEEFCTDARVRKAVLKFVNEESLPLDLRLMAKVPSHVIKDILKEEFGTIYDKYKFIDFKEMKKKVPKLCLKVINDMMIEKC